MLATKYSDIDVLVNNAGAIPGGNLLGVDEATWRKAWDLKVFGYINMCRSFYALMKKRGSGVIINVTGNAALTRDPDYICGVTGNAALTAFSQSLGSVSPRDGIRVISVNPGPVETERLAGLMKKRAQDKTGDAENWRELFKPLAFGRACAPEEIGRDDRLSVLGSVQLQQRICRGRRWRCVGAIVIVRRIMKFMRTATTLISHATAVRTFNMNARL